MTGGRERGHAGSLDSVCALAITCVLLPHLASAFGPTARRIADHYTYFGALGVQVFLVISGYLVTKRLFGERGRGGSIDLGRFYGRVARRIVPPFYSYLGVIALLAIFGLIRQPLAGIASAATFTSNYAPNTGWYPAHAWLLAVGVQFIVWWPVLVALAGVRARWAAWALVLVCPLFRWWTLVRLNGAYGFDHRFETTADFMAIGCLAATHAEAFRARVRDVSVHPLVVVGLLLFVTVFLTAQKGHPRFDLLVGRTMTAFAIAGLVLAAAHAAETSTPSVLGWAPLRWLGRISYSLYLWQQLPFVPTGRWDALGVGVRFAIAFALAFASYYLIEQRTAPTTRAVYNPDARTIV